VCIQQVPEVLIAVHRSLMLCLKVTKKYTPYRIQLMRSAPMSDTRTGDSLADARGSEQWRNVASIFQRGAAEERLAAEGRVEGVDRQCEKSCHPRKPDPRVPGRQLKSNREADQETIKKVDAAHARKPKRNQTRTRIPQIVSMDIQVI
jgi:hypothetical protein